MHAMYQLFLYFIIYVHFISRYICALRVQTTIILAMAISHSASVWLWTLALLFNTSPVEMTFMWGGLWLACWCWCWCWCCWWTLDTRYMQGEERGHFPAWSLMSRVVGTPLSILGGDPKTNYGRKGKFIERIFLLSQTASINTYKHGEIITYK